MNTLLRKYRLPLALAIGFVVLAMQSPGASFAFARGVVPGGSITSTVAPDTVYCPSSLPPHGSCGWSGNFAYGALHSYGKASGNFRVPTITGTNAAGAVVSFWVGLGGIQTYGGAATELVQAGITTTATTAGGQRTSVWYEHVGPNDNGTPQPVTIPGEVHQGDLIDVTVSSNYQGDGEDKFYFTNETTGNKAPAVIITGHKSDGATGECIGERPASSNDGGITLSYQPIPDFGTEWLNDCTMSTDQATNTVGNWPHDWYHILNANGDVLIGVGALDDNGSFPLDWKGADKRSPRPRARKEQEEAASWEASQTLPSTFTPPRNPSDLRDAVEAEEGILLVHIFSPLAFLRLTEGYNLSPNFSIRRGQATKSLSE